MRFDELNEDNYVMFAIKHYENPHAVTQDDFYEDLKRFKWIKRLLKRYQTTGILKSHLLINHFIILYNVFGEAQLHFCSLKLIGSCGQLLRRLLYILVGCRNILDLRYMIFQSIQIVCRTWIRYERSYS